MATLTKSEREELKSHAVEMLDDIKRYDLIYTTTTYVGRNGTAYVRVFRVNAVGNTPKIENITYWVANATGQTLRDKDGQRAIHTGGYGYHRGHHIVDALSWALFGESNQLNQIDL